MSEHNYRFYVVPKFKELGAVAVILDTLGYEELDYCIDEYSYEGQKIIIDTEKKTWWFIDQEALEQTRKVIELKFFGERTKNITLNEIEQWEK